MSSQVVILHGWSDDSKSFKPLAEFLQASGFDTIPIVLTDYISLRDDVRLDDVTKRMEEVISERIARPVGAEGRLGPSFHMIVHSTGGLVARRWISRYYADRPCPVKNLVMLAPANFGSKLAHIGRSMLGRVLKGVKTGFETGEEILYALELASPFLWDLAQDDLFDLPGGPRREPLYGADRVRPFVIVGTYPYDSIGASITNENGSDGTVRVAGANMNVYGVTIDFSGDPEHLLSPRLIPWPHRGGPHDSFPLAVLPDRNHGTIKDPTEPGYAKDPEAQARLGELVLRALRSRTADQYDAIREEWDAITMDTRTFAGDALAAQKHRDDFFTEQDVPRQYFHEHYQVFVRAVDEFGVPIPDYFVAFMPQWKEKAFFGLRSKLPKESVFFHEEVLEDVHRHRSTPANICMYMDRFDLMREGGFYDQVSGSKLAELAFTVSADSPGDRVSYFSRGANARHGLVQLHDRDSTTNRWLRRHSTHFVTLVIPRAGRPDIFTLEEYTG